MKNRTAAFAATSLALLSLAASSSLLFAAEKAVMLGHAAPTQQVGFDVYIPVQNHARLEQDLEKLNDSSSPLYHKWLTPAEANARYGASAKQVAAIQNQLAGFGLQSTVVTGHHIHVTGSAGNIEQALGTVLKNGQFKSGRAIVAATQPMTPPDALVQVGAAVIGLSGAIHAHTNAHMAAAQPSDAIDNRKSTHGDYWFTDLKQAYSFPSYQSYTGKGVTIATLVDGAYSPTDMALYFAHELLPVPNFQEVAVDGGAPFNGDSFETNLDFQQAGGMAPDATIIHYNIADLSDQSLLDGISQIITDNKADVVSISIGGPELLYTKEYNGGTDYTYIPKLYDDLYALGNVQGITFVVSSGDTGAPTTPPLACFDSAATSACGAMRPSVNFIASSPHVTAVGGTNLATTYDGGATLNSAYVGEEAYGDPLTKDIDFGTPATGNYWGSGGGDSIIFKKPLYQTLANTGNNKFRTLPDVSGHMGGCPGGGSVQGPCNPADSADYEYFNGHLYGVIGTSASAPDFAGLVALTIQRFNSGYRIGNINNYIYTLALAQSLGVTGKVYNQGIPGFNGLYSGTATGYNRVLGVGTVNGINFLLAPTLAAAGVPQTPSNP